MVSVAFICVHNSCRSQIAESLGNYYGKKIIECYSAGEMVVKEINKDAVRLVKKLYGIDMNKTQYSKTIDKLPKVDIVITMGCNVNCPYIPAKSIEDWGIEDPSGKSDDVYLDVIETIDKKVKDLIKRIKAGKYNY